MQFPNPIESKDVKVCIRFVVFFCFAMDHSSFQGKITLSHNSYGELATEDHIKVARQLKNLYFAPLISCPSVLFLGLTFSHPTLELNIAKPMLSSAQPTTCQSFLKPPPIRPSKVEFSWKLRAPPWLEVRASLKEEAATGLTAAALTASMVIPEAAVAAGPGISPYLKNFLLSIVAGGVVLTAIIGAAIGVSNFDPVKRS